jgi:hypothetical protein
LFLALIKVAPGGRGHYTEVDLIQIKFYRPNWFMRRSFVLHDYFEGSGRI